MLRRFLRPHKAKEHPMTATYTDRLQGVATSTAVKAPARVATTANITLSGLQILDAIALAEADRVLVKNQTDTAQNGLWLASSGAWVRTLDFDDPRDVRQGTMVYVVSGTVGGGYIYRVSTADPITPGTTGLGFDVLTFSTSGVPSTREIASGTGLTGGGDLFSNRTLALTGQALALHNLASSGLVARTAADTFAARTLNGGSFVSVTDGNGVSGNPTIDIPASVIVTASETVAANDNDTTIPTSAAVLDLFGAAGRLWTYYSGVSLSGTTIDFTAIPAAAREVRLFLNGASLNGTENIGIQLGVAAGMIATGYIANGGALDAAALVTIGPSTTQFLVHVGNASDVVHGYIDFMRGNGPNSWFCSYTISTGDAHVSMGGGRIDLGDVLTQLRVKSASANTFDSGTAYIAWR
jgi:hypothetical protein